jgi:alkanesulfonate monooxygenase SsuD/methylene tetrahydromethanopterin reductase-like flavin-dependent oxidoreductase (luciferase family)
MGEKKTLRLVAQYANACNFFPSPELPHKLDVLREHCRAVGRNYDEIEKTAMFTLDVGNNGEKVSQTLNGLRWLAEMGIETAIGSVPHIDRIKPLEIIGEKLVPAAAQIETKTASPA